MKTRTWPRLCAAGILCLLGMTAASSWSGEGRFDLMEPEIWMAEAFRDKPESRPKRVAVLPLVNETDAPEGAEVVRRAIYNHFSSLSYIDLEMSQTDQRLRQAYLGDAKALANAPPAKLAEILKTDAILRGKVTSFARVFALVASSVTVGAELELVRIPDGQVLWRGKQTAVSIDGGLPTSPLDILLTVIASAVNMRETVLYRVTDQLAREIIGTIPDTPDRQTIRPPVIRMVVHNAANLPRKAGDVLEVGMEGEAGHYASFDIGAAKKGLAMEEVQPGVYRGRYRVAPGDQAERETLVVHLGDAAGNVSQWMDFQGPITLDTRPPKTPGSLTGRGMDGKVVLQWKGVADEDLAAYTLLRSESPLSGYREVARVEGVSHTDGGLRNQTVYYYKVGAVDRAGNASAASQSVAVTPMPAGPTPVNADPDRDTVWRKAASPYLVEKSIVVPRDVRLEVEAGVEIIPASAVGITVKGTLVMAGTADDPVLIHGAEGRKWQGILLDQSRKENLLRHVSLRDAELGVVVYGARVVLEAMTLTRNHGTMTLIEAPDAVLRQSELAHNLGPAVVVSKGNPVIQDNRIHHNDGFGVVVRQGLPTLKGNHLQDNREFDLVAFNEGKTPLDLSGNGWGTCQPFQVWDRVVAWHVNKSCLPRPGDKPVALAATLPESGRGAALREANALSTAARKFQEGDHAAAYLALAGLPAEERLAPAQYLFGRLWSASGQMKEALAAFQKASDQDPEQPGYAYWLGIQHVRMGQSGQAERVWRNLIAQGDHPPTQRMLQAMR